MKKEIWQGDFGGDQNSSPKAPPRSRKGLERRKKKGIRRGASGGGTIKRVEKSESLRKRR